MDECDWNQEKQVDRIPAGRVRFVGPALEPGDGLNAPPSFIATESRDRREVCQAKTGRGCEQRDDQRCQNAAIALSRGVTVFPQTPRQSSVPSQWFAT